ncbi:transcriptional regulator with XRE-family HTH domain [Runella defluvii]|uniref:Transcriptional regulator with XRE-family HTH domain n=1 Tax=Runella defluvii TaxID=370973 RepID=A0A7W5ZNM2_9BACT|nr:helix-turn-helix transcriptional regulator [Runella defluvii]MBB3840725.1 transcriptional regulator with XRE-family HTH domain [Runella defluvii]
MNEIHIGLAIRNLADEKKLSAEQLAELLSIDRQSVYATYKRANVSPKTIEKYAKVIGVTVNDVMQKAGYSNTVVLQTETPFKSEDNYLIRRLSDLEEMVNFLKGQVIEKDKQINVLLGKSDSVPLARFAALPLFFCG